MFRFGRFAHPFFEGESGGGGGAAAPTADPAAPAAPAAPESATDPDPVPYDRFKAVNETAKAAEARAAEAERQLKALQNQGKSAEERAAAEAQDANARAEAAEKRAADLEAAQARSERNGWVREAAKDFHDPSDAVALLADADIKTPAQAERAVKALAEKRGHLVNKADPSRDPAKLLDRVLNRGKAGDGDADVGDAVIPAADLEAMTQEELVALQQRDPALYERSLAAARGD